MKIFTIGFTKKSAETFFTRLRLFATSTTSTFPNAPTADILDPYKKAKNGDWELYERKFLDLMRSRRIASTVAREMLDGGCLLCSEEKSHHCHRRLVAEYLKEHWPDVEIEHIP